MGVNRHQALPPSIAAVVPGLYLTYRNPTNLLHLSGPQSQAVRGLHPKLSAVTVHYCWEYCSGEGRAVKLSDTTLQPPMQYSTGYHTGHSRAVKLCDVASRQGPSSCCCLHSSPVGQAAAAVQLPGITGDAGAVWEWGHQLHITGQTGAARGAQLPPL